MLKGKKAQRSVVLYAVLILITLALLTFLFIKFKTSSEQYNKEQLCRNSVEISSYKLSGESLMDIINCPTQYETIEAADDEAIKHEVAERMRMCKWMFLEGKRELFDEEAENFCAICYVLDFKEKKKVAGFVNYLTTHTLPQSKTTTYYQYFTPYSTTEELAEKAKASTQDFIDTNQKYAIMFNYAKPEYLSKLESGEIGAGAGAAGGIGALVLINLIPGVNAFTIPATATALVAGGATGFYFGWGKGETADWSASVMLWPYTEDEAKRLHCQYAPVKTK